MGDKVQRKGEIVPLKTISLQFGEIGIEKLNALCGRTLATSYDDIADRALTFLDWCVTAWGDGKKILFVNDVDAIILSRKMLDQGTNSREGTGGVEGDATTMREFSFSKERFETVMRLRTLLARSSNGVLFADIFSCYEFYLDKLLEGRSLQYEDSTGETFDVERTF